MGRRGRGVVATYRLHHRSNGGPGRVNPAVTSHLRFLGVRWRVTAG